MNRISKSSFLCLALILSPLFFLGQTLAHPGRTDSSGCHNDRKNGGYHCHGGGYTAPPSTNEKNPSSPPEIPKTKNEASETKPKPVCYKATKTVLIGTLWKDKDSIPFETGEIDKMITVEAKLMGIEGKLVTYNIGQITVKKFLPNDKSPSKYKLDKATWDWVLITNYAEQDKNKLYYLEKNPDELISEEISSSQQVKEICSQ